MLEQVPSLWWQISTVVLAAFTPTGKGNEMRLRCVRNPGSQKFTLQIMYQPETLIWRDYNPGFWRWCYSDDTNLMDDGCDDASEDGRSWGGGGGSGIWAGNKTGCTFQPKQPHKHAKPPWFVDARVIKISTLSIEGGSARLNRGIFLMSSPGCASRIRKHKAALNLLLPSWMSSRCTVF